METETRKNVLGIARRWIGTPYCHQASARGAGTDCLGLVRGIWRELYGNEPEAIPPYTPNWTEEHGEETLLNAARRWLQPVDLVNAKSGDVMLFRLAAHAPCKHIAILASPDTMIHAYAGHAVMETPLVPWWCRRWEFAFAFTA